MGLILGVALALFILVAVPEIILMFLYALFLILGFLIFWLIYIGLMVWIVAYATWEVVSEVFMRLKQTVEQNMRKWRIAWARKQKP